MDGWGLKALAGLAIVAVVVGLLAAMPFVARAYNDNANEEKEEVDIANGTIAVMPILGVNATQAIAAAYNVRNVTYPLFQWEISKNVTAANVTLNVGDKLLAMAESSNNTRRAVALALASILHYSQSVGLATIVLHRNLSEALGQYGNVTADVVLSVLALDQEFKGVLQQGIKVADDLGIGVPNLTNVLISKGDDLIANATALLQSNETLKALKASIEAYYAYDLAYGVLVKEVALNSLGLKVELSLAKPIAPMFVICKVKPKSLLPAIKGLPSDMRRAIEEGIQNGTINDVDEMIEHVRNYSAKVSVEIEREEAEHFANFVTEVVVKIFSKHGLKVDEDLVRNTVMQAVNQWISKGNLSGNMSSVLSNVLSQVGQQLNVKHRANVDVETEFEHSVTIVIIKYKH
ncbi:MAG: hypothetical protein ABWK00_05225 [Desulfurococcaceae archaeon]